MNSKAEQKQAALALRIASCPLRMLSIPPYLLLGHDRPTRIFFSYAVFGEYYGID